MKKMILLATSMVLFSATAFAAAEAMTTGQINEKLQQLSLILDDQGEGEAVACYGLDFKDHTLTWETSGSKTYKLNTLACEKDPATGLTHITFMGGELACSSAAPADVK